MTNKSLLLNNPVYAMAENSDGKNEYPFITKDVGLEIDTINTNKTGANTSKASAIINVLNMIFVAGDTSLMRKRRREERFIKPDKAHTPLICI